jgi:hypothetical protein
MNEDYKTSLATHDSEQDLAWWDQNYGMLMSFVLYLYFFFISFIGTQTNNRWPEFEEYRD